MKDMFESSEVFTAYATIDAGYALMEMAQDEFEKTYPKNTIEAMIDKETGFAKDKMNKHIAYLCICLDDIIKAKKFIKADYSTAVKTKKLLLSKVIK